MKPGKGGMKIFRRHESYKAGKKSYKEIRRTPISGKSDVLYLQREVANEDATEERRETGWMRD